ncbi:MAG: bifunctional DNA primase/polymerase [Chloroflexota bacterium]|nr:bifunctional DNA primase/polymerase [Chloroflexota bacterium]
MPGFFLRARKGGRALPRKQNAGVAAPALRTTHQQLPQESLAKELVGKYLDRGFALMPLRSGEKTPRDQNWPRRWAEQRADELTVSTWLAQGLNIGILTGQASGGLVVADIDFGEGADAAGDEAPDELLDFLQGLGTPVAMTASGGFHVYLRSGTRTGSTKLVLTGVPVLLCGDAKQVVAPPSAVDGRAYDFLVPLRGGELLLDVDDFTLRWNREKPLRGARGTVGIPTPPRRASKPLSGLALYDGDVSFVADVCDLLKLRVRGKFSCVLPGHGPDRDPSASLWRDKRGIWVYRDHHAASGAQSYTLTEVYASARAGRVMDFGEHRSAHAQWKLRLLHELGMIELPEIVAPGLPTGAPASVRKFLDGVVLLSRVRAYHWGVLEPAPFTEDFATAWCGISKTRYWEARKYLMRERIVRPAGRVKEQRGMRLFQLSTETPIDVEREVEEIWRLPAT